MTATLACPSCHTRLKLPDRITGRRLKCPKCGSAVSVPPADTDHPAAGQQPRSTILPPLLIGGGVLAVLLFAVVVTILHPVQQSVDPVVAGSSPVALAFMEPSPILVQPDADGRGSVRNVLPRCLVDTDGHQGSCARQPLSRQTGGVLEDIANPLVMNLLHPLGSHQPACATRGTGCRRHRQRRRMADQIVAFSSAAFFSSAVPNGSPLTNNTMSSRRSWRSSTTVNWFTARKSLFSGLSKFKTRTRFPPSEPSGRWYSTGTPSTRNLWTRWLLAISDGRSGRVSLRNA